MSKIRFLQLLDDVIVIVCLSIEGAAVKMSLNGLLTALLLVHHGRQQAQNFVAVEGEWKVSGSILKTLQIGFCYRRYFGRFLVIELILSPTHETREIIVFV